MKNSPLGVRRLPSVNGSVLGTTTCRTVGTFSWPYLGIISCRLTARLGFLRWVEFGTSSTRWPCDLFYTFYLSSHSRVGLASMPAFVSGQKA